MVYHMTIAGLERDLPVCKVSDSLYIGAFVIFGDQELTVALPHHSGGQGHPPGPRNGPAERRQKVHAGSEGAQAVHDRGL